MDLDINTIDTIEYIKCTESKIKELYDETELVQQEITKNLELIENLKLNIKAVDEDIKQQIEDSRLISQVFDLRMKIKKVNKKIKIAKELVWKNRNSQRKNEIKLYRAKVYPSNKRFLKIQP